ncbi:MAG: glycosyltransferase family 4 protein [Planctomycetota bacterium]
MSLPEHPLKLLIISGIFHPEIGGPSRYLYNLARYLQENGHQVTVIAFSAEPSRYHYPYKVIRILRKISLPFRLFQMWCQILVHGIRADVLFVNDYGIPSVLANLLLRKPIVLKIVGDWAWEYSIRHQLTQEGIEEFQKKPHQGRIRWVQKIQQMYVSRVNHIITPSRYLQKIVSGWMKRPVPVRVIYNALDATHYHLPESKEVAKKELGWSFRYMLTIARLNPWKGVDTVINLMKSLPEEVHYVVIGEGPEFQKLKKLSQDLQLEERVHLLGRMDLEKVGPYLKGAELLVLYTGYEGLSHVLLESLLAGLPIVTTDIGGNPEVVSSPEYGALVPYGDEKKLQATLEHLLTQPEALRALAEGSTKRHQDFSWPTLLSQTLQLLQEIRQSKKSENHSS